VEQKVKTPREVMKSMKFFITFMCISGPVLGVIAACLYRWVVVTYGQWEPSKDSFHFGIIIYGLGVTLPILSISCRLMIKMFFQNCEQIENMNYVIGMLKDAHDRAPHLLEKVEKVIDKAIPISNSIEEVVGRAKGMAEDVEKIAHRVRAATDAMNGSFDFKVIEQKLTNVSDSLGTIASMFSPLKKKNGELSVPELMPFDPLKTGGKR
jgi:hypothetical protein